MSMTETIVESPYADKPLTEAQQKARQSAELIPFGEHGVTPATFAAAVDFAKMMAQARSVVPQHLQGAPAACLAIIDLASKFQMSPYMLATRTLVVNGVLSFDGQGIMAIMNKHLPLAKTEDGKKTRLKYTFTGEHAQYEPQEIDEIDERTGNKTGKRIWINKLIKPSTRAVLVTGRMEGEAEDLPYQSPTVFNIKNKKSPLWVEDEDQQLIYWASRRWQRRWWPEGLLGIYDPEEAAEMHQGADNAKLIMLEDRGQQLLERLEANKVKPDADAPAIREGFDPDHAHKETTVVLIDQAKPGSDKTVEVTAHVEDGKVVVDTVKEVEPEKAPEQAKPKSTKKKADKIEPEPEHEVLPKTEAELIAWTTAWIKELKPNQLDKRWKEEAPLRNELGISEKVRDQLFDALLAKRDG